MKRSLRPWIGLFLLSLTLYGVSVYVSEKKLCLVVDTPPQYSNTQRTAVCGKSALKLI